jgi:phospholipase/carboxylesterase
MRGYFHRQQDPYQSPSVHNQVLMTSQGLVRTTVPARAGQPPHPGLLLLHGRGADEHDLLPIAYELDPRLYVVSARAPFRFPYGGYMWYDLDPRGVGYPDDATLEQSLQQLRALLAEISSELPIDPGRLFIGGFSMGAAMSAALALTEPERLVGGIVLSGYLPLHAGLRIENDKVAGHPVFAAHGIYDPVIPIQFGRMTRDALARFPVELTYKEYPIGHEIGGEELADLRAWLSGVLDRSQDLSATAE